MAQKKKERKKERKKESKNKNMNTLKGKEVQNWKKLAGIVI